MGFGVDLIGPLPELRARCFYRNEAEVLLRVELFCLFVWILSFDARPISAQGIFLHHLGGSSCEEHRTDREQQDGSEVRSESDPVGAICA